jgi:hypothetical protein
VTSHKDVGENEQIFEDEVAEELFVLDSNRFVFLAATTFNQSLTKSVLSETTYFMTGWIPSPERKA